MSTTCLEWFLTKSQCHHEDTDIFSSRSTNWLKVGRRPGFECQQSIITWYLKRRIIEHFNLHASLNHQGRKLYNLPSLVRFCCCCCCCCFLLLLLLRGWRGSCRRPFYKTSSMKKKEIVKVIRITFILRGIMRENILRRKLW